MILCPHLAPAEAQWAECVGLHGLLERGRYECPGDPMQRVCGPGAVAAPWVVGVVPGPCWRLPGKVDSGSTTAAQSIGHCA